MTGANLHAMAGLYVHIPFCAQACTYCDFHFTTRLGDRDAMVAALRQEIRSAIPHWQGERFTTLYFGGGTPSLLGPAALADIASEAFDGADWDLAEWTVEANPEDIDPNTLDALLDVGVNRLSIGVQSFERDVLEWMRRIHGADKAEVAVRNAAAAGFEHLSVDLIYGVPVGGEDRWKRDLDVALSLPADHLSAYILTAEPQTLYGHQLKKGEVAEPPDEQVLREYECLIRRTSEAGFSHYEVSNFALPGGHSQHNSAYWDRLPYLGIGPGAHSFRGAQRWWNARSNARYLKAAKAGAFASQQESETLGPTERFNERLMTGLRRIEGVDPAQLLADTGRDLLTRPRLQPCLDAGHLEWAEGRLRIPEHHWPTGDAITVELME